MITEKAWKKREKLKQVMSNQNKQAEYICSRCGSKGWVIGYDNGTIIKCPCCSAVWMENVVL